MRKSTQRRIALKIRQSIIKHCASKICTQNVMASLLTEAMISMGLHNAFQIKYLLRKTHAYKP